MYVVSDKSVFSVVSVDVYDLFLKMKNKDNHTVNQFCESSANTIMLVANATTDHTKRRITTCQHSKDFGAMQNIR